MGASHGHSRSSTAIGVPRCERLDKNAWLGADTGQASAAWLARLEEALRVCGSGVRVDIFCEIAADDFDAVVCIC